MKLFALIVAGGSGSRMESDLPKQFLLLCAKPVLMHTLQKFYTFNNKIEIILVLPDNQIDYWAKLCKDYAYSVPHKIVVGGATRIDSVKNGLQAITDTVDSLVAIHDGVRPLVSAQTLKNCYSTAMQKGNAVPCISIFDSIRKTVGNTTTHINRDEYKAIQTPQVFKTSTIKTAYQNAISGNFTDDASVAESAGVTIHLVDGNRENIKITTPFDMLIAETALMQHTSLL